MLRRGVAVARASLGEHPTTATALNNLGLVLMDWHGLEEAEQVYAEALRIDVAQIGPRLALSRLLLEKPGTQDEAMNLLRESVALRERF